MRNDGPSPATIVAGCTIGNAVSLTPAIHTTFGTFLVPLSATFGWSRASISGVLSLVAVAGMLLYPVAGRFADRHGARGILIAGNLLLGAAIAGLGLADGDIVHFYLAFALVAIAGALPSTPVLSKVVSDWFDRRRGTMLGISAGFGNGIGGTAMPIAAAVLLSAFGWRWAYAGIGAIVVIVGLPAFLLLVRDAPRHDASTSRAADAPADAGLSLREAAETRAFWLVLVAIASGAGCLTAVFSHIVPILGDRGIGLASATAVLSTFALVTAAWQVAMGTLLDRIATPRIAGPMALAAVAGLALVELGAGTPALIGGGVLLGIGLGTQYGALPFFVARYFGVRHFGAIVGAMYSAVALAQGLTPVLLDHAFDVQGTYRFAVAVVGACLTGGALLLLLLPAYAASETVVSYP